MNKCKVWILYFKQYGHQDIRTVKYFKKLIRYILKIEDYHSNEGSDSDDWEDDSSQQEDSDEYDREDDDYRHEDSDGDTDTDDGNDPHQDDSDAYDDDAY